MSRGETYKFGFILCTKVPYKTLASIYAPMHNSVSELLIEIISKVWGILAVIKRVSSFET